jgi:hypothetical protein
MKLHYTLQLVSLGQPLCHTIYTFILFGAKPRKFDRTTAELQALKYNFIDSTIALI